jgi:sugar phosphate isomerase/epimerase
MRLSIVTDEISQDLERALLVCRDLGVHTIELRGVYGKNIVAHDADSITHIHSLIQHGGFRVCSIASPFLKCPLWEKAGSEEEEQEWRFLHRSFELAYLFDAPLVRTFSFMRVPDPTTVRQTVLDVIGEAVQRTEAAGLKLVIENEHACNIATGEETGWLLERIKSDAFGVIWDPGNEAKVGSQAFPAGYHHVRGRVLHMHLKDVAADRSYVKMGDGVIDYIGQFRALVADGYNRTLSLETHYNHPEGGREQASRESFAAIRTMLQEAGARF